MGDDLDERIPSDLGSDRRTFVKRVVTTAVIAAPFVASFDLQEAGPALAKATAPVE